MIGADRTAGPGGLGGLGNFERRLGEELRALAAERAPAPRRSTLPGRPLLASLVAVAAALILPATLGGGPGGTSGYAVAREPDGTLALRLRDPAGLPGLVAALRHYGVPAAGLAVADDGSCPLPAPRGRRVAPDRRLPGDSPDTVRVDPGLLPPGGTVLLTSWTDRAAGVVRFGAAGVDTVPACASAPAGVD